MTRYALTDDSGAWFEGEKATLFDEDTFFNGSNRISIPTESQWDHQQLFLTKTLKWVLRCYSQWQGSIDSYEEIEESDAVKWLIQNDHSHGANFDDLPQAIQRQVAKVIVAAEI